MHGIPGIFITWRHSLLLAQRTSQPVTANNNATSARNTATAILPDVIPAEFAATYLCDLCRDTLPDLSHTVLLIPRPQAAPVLRRAISREATACGFNAVLLPPVLTLPDFLDTLPLPTGPKVISAERRPLMLVEALKTRQDLYGSGSPWLLAENLLQLFDEITLFHVEMPADTDDFIQRLAKAYAIHAEQPALLREARRVHLLWKAWHEQLDAEGLQDIPARYLRRLGESLKHIPPDLTFLLLDFDQFIPAELQWLNTLATTGRMYILQTRPEILNADYQPVDLALSRVEHTQDNNKKSDGFGALLDACYSVQTATLKDRIESFRAAYPQSPVGDRLKMLAAADLEQEVQAIALQIRSALAQGQRNVGVVTEDRRLARRLRAVLERSGISLQDTAGWALSTSRAAAIVESWLECVELDFPHTAFLDLLKSPPITAADNQNGLNLVYRLEHDIIRHENIASGLQRYQQALKHRAARLPLYWQTHLPALQTLLKRFEKSAVHLQTLLDKTVAASIWLQLLNESLDALDITNYLADDPAGAAILNLILHMREAADSQTITLNWTEFRAWWGRSLEQHYFNPTASERYDVRLFNLAQSKLQYFDTLIIAAADEQHLPGDRQILPFFNDAVRSSLGLPDHRHHLRTNEALFRVLLQSSTSVLISWQRMRDGETINPCTWVAALAHFHLAAYHNDLQDAELLHAVKYGDLLSGITDDEVPATVPQQPAPTAPASLIPGDISVSAHQRLINCPYQFFVSDVLRLKPVDEIREALRKSDYGSRVHDCLHAFHTGVENLPGPFDQPLTDATRAAAQALLENISRRIFTRDIEDNFQHRGWLQKWLAFIPSYLDWQIEHGKEWQILDAEREYTVALDENLSLHGRIDRIEKRATGSALGLIDYKTGKPPRPDKVANGEDVQLLSYSLLLEHVSQVLYLGLDGRSGVDDKTLIEEETLVRLNAQVKQRLITAFRQLREQTEMRAFADAQTCRYCDAAGVCRRQVWERIR